MCQFSRSSNILNYPILNISNYNIFTYRFFPKMNSFNVLFPKYQFRPYQSCFKLKVNLFFPKLFKKTNKSNAQTHKQTYSLPTDCLFYMCALEVRLQVVIKNLLVSLITILDFYPLQKTKYLKTSKKIPFDSFAAFDMITVFFSTVTR